MCMQGTSKPGRSGRGRGSWRQLKGFKTGNCCGSTSCGQERMAADPHRNQRRMVTKFDVQLLGTPRSMDGEATSSSRVLHHRAGPPSLLFCHQSLSSAATGTSQLTTSGRRPPRGDATTLMARRRPRQTPSSLISAQVLRCRRAALPTGTPREACILM